jgi:hypothetical protein
LAAKIRHQHGGPNESQVQLHHPKLDPKIWPALRIYTRTLLSLIPTALNNINTTITTTLLLAANPLTSLYRSQQEPVSIPIAPTYFTTLFH